MPGWAKPIFDLLHIGFFVDAKTRTITFTDWDKYKLLTASAARQAKQVNSLATPRPLTADEQALLRDYQFVDDKTVLLNASNAVSQGKANARPVSPNDAITRTQVFATTDTLFNITSDQLFEMSLITPGGQAITPLNYDQAPISPTLKIAYSEVTTYTLPDDRDTAPRWRVINAAFDATRRDLAVRLDGATVFTGINLLDARNGYTTTISGTHTLGVVLSGQTDPALTLPLNAEDEHAYSLIVPGGNLAETLIVNDDNAMPIAFNSARLRLINTAAQAPAAFDVSVDGAAWVNGSVFKAVSDYRELAAGSHTVEVRNASDQTVLATQVIALDEGGVYSLFASDYISDTEYMLNLSILPVLDEQYRITTITQYGVAQAPIGEWQVKLVGDTDTANWTMGVLGQPNSPLLTDVTLDASQLDAAQVSLNVKSEYQPITLTYKLKSDDLTSEMVFTDTDGLSITAIVP